MNTCALFAALSTNKLFDVSKSLIVSKGVMNLCTYAKMEPRFTVNTQIFPLYLTSSLNRTLCLILCFDIIVSISV